MSATTGPLAFEATLPVLPISLTALVPWNVG